MTESNYVIRKDWVDALRALAMVFVIFGHQAQWYEPFFQYTTPIKIPLFFAISGYLFKTRGYNQNAFWLNLFWKLIIPYFCLVTIPVLFFIPFYGIDYLFKAWKGMLDGSTYWFIPCLIIGEIIHFYIRIIARRTIWIVCGCLFVASIGLLLARNGIGNYAKLNNALICQSFLLLGYLYKYFESTFLRIKPIWGWVTFFVYVVLCFLSKQLFADVRLDINLNIYYNAPYVYCLIIIGCISLFKMFSSMSSINSWISFIGKNTFLLYYWCPIKN